MATTICSFLIVCFLSLQCIICSMEASHDQATHRTHDFQILQLSSLQPQTTCTTRSSPDSKEATASLEVIHRQGPCIRNKGDHHKPNGAAAIADHFNEKIQLQLDQSRVNSIQSKISRENKSGSVILPADEGSPIGYSSYVVQVGLGTQKDELLLVFDTGSDLLWTQCKPCTVECYKQVDPIFDPTKSKSYTNLSCNSRLCTHPDEGYRTRCTDSTCTYGVGYGDKSYTMGFLAQETLTLTSSNVFKNFIFGCGVNNHGLFGGIAGLIGLGRGKTSFVTQTSSKYRQVFSYCLPSSTSYSGHLTFGMKGESSVKYTPLVTVSDGSTLYGLNLIAISVGGKKLPISATVFSKAGTIIDSGTVISRLPPGAYSALRAEFAAQMRSYPKAKPSSILDTCYNLKGYAKISVPSVSLHFSGLTLQVDKTGTLYSIDQKTSVYCLAFAANSNASDVAIFGSWQQRTLEVVYDVGRGKVGFAPGGCN